MFSPPDSVSMKIEEQYGALLKEYTTAIHVRHGDYAKYKDVHPPCTMEYYNEAISQLPKDSKFLVISDTMEWCRENFKGDQFYFVDSSFQQDYMDFYLMCRCENNIIANSTFSWWAAWLNNNENKRVLFPKRWFGEKVDYSTADLTPPMWECV